MKLLEDLPFDPSFKPSNSALAISTSKLNLPQSSTTAKPEKLYTVLTNVTRIEPSDLSLLDLEGTKPLSLISK